MPIVRTNWEDRVSPFDAFVDGKQQPIPWLFGSNAPVYIDLAPQLLEGETVVSVTATLRRLPVNLETDYTDFPAGMEGTPVVAGTVVSQVLQDLERGRVYRLEVIFGAVNNRRGASLLIECIE